MPRNLGTWGENATTAPQNPKLCVEKKYKHIGQGNWNFVLNVLLICKSGTLWVVWSIIWIYELKFELTPHLKTATKNYTASMVFEIIGPNDLSYFEFFSVEINKKLQECGILLKTLQMRTLKFYYLFLYVQIFWKLVVHENTNSIKVMTPLQSGNWNSIHVVSFYCFIISCYF